MQRCSDIRLCNWKHIDNRKELVYLRVANERTVGFIIKLPHIWTLSTVSYSINNSVSDTGCFLPHMRRWNSATHWKQLFLVTFSPEDSHISALRNVAFFKEYQTMD